MDHPYQTSMQLPAAYAVITEEEMTYLDGGSEIVLGNLFGYQLSLDTDQFMTFCASVVVNFSYALLGTSFNYVTGIFESGVKNGLSLAGSVAHAWGRLETPGSRIGALGAFGLAGLYVGMQTVSIVRSLRSLYDTIFNPMPTFDTAATGTAGAAAA